jgi:hypothetical protein
MPATTAPQRRYFGSTSFTVLVAGSLAARHARRRRVAVGAHYSGANRDLFASMDFQHGVDSNRHAAAQSQSSARTTGFGPPRIRERTFVIVRRASSVRAAAVHFAVC